MSSILARAADLFRRKNGDTRHVMFDSWTTHLPGEGAVASDMVSVTIWRNPDGTESVTTSMICLEESKVTSDRDAVYTAIGMLEFGKSDGGMTLRAMDREAAVQ